MDISNPTLEFTSSVRTSTLLQKISLSLQEKYQFIKSLSDDSIWNGIAPADIQKDSWLLSRAFERLENRIYREELSKILDELRKGIPLVPTENSADGQKVLPASAVVTGQVQDAWTRDESIRLLHRETLLETVGVFLFVLLPV
jgi:hypothetical protein